MFKLKRAQMISEYALLLSLVVIIMVTMFTLIKRSTQKLTQLAADQIGRQVNAEQDFASNKGFMVNQITTSAFQTQHDKLFRYNDKGYGYNDSTYTGTKTYSNQGFTEKEPEVVTNSTVDLPALPLP